MKSPDKQKALFPVDNHFLEHTKKRRLSASRHTKQEKFISSMRLTNIRSKLFPDPS